MHSNDFNMIQALISQAPLEQLQDVKALIEGEIEIQWNRQNMLKQKQAQKQEAVHKVIPRFASPFEKEVAGVAGLAGSPTPQPNYDTCNAKEVADVKLHVAESGATSSHVPLRYDIIPRSLIERAAERYTFGIKLHGERNYQRGLADRGHIISRINHIYEHLNKLFHPDYRKADNPDDEEGITHKAINDNLGAILWGVGFICEVADHKQGWEILRELRDQGRVKTHSD